MIALTLALPLGAALPGRPADPIQEERQEPRQQDEPRAGLKKLQSLYQLPEGFVQFARVPEGGLQPRLGSGRGETAVLYYKGGEEQGDLFVARTRDEAKSFSPSVRVNAEPASVACAERMHGGSIDLGPDGSAHVAWTSGGERSLRYAHIAPGLEPAPPIDLGAPPGLCLSTAITVDARGRVLVFFAAASDPAELESVPPQRKVWMRASDDGVEFAPAVCIDEGGRGVSESSLLAAHVDDTMGTIFVLYRCAYAPRPNVQNLSRGMRLLASSDGTTFDTAWVDNWRSVRDPRSFALLCQEELSTLAIWESGGEVFWSMIRRHVKKANLPTEPKEDGPPVVRSKPSGAAGGGEVLLAWLERPKESPGSAPRLAWRVWLREGRAPIGSGFAPESPQSGAPAVFARAAGGFTVLY